MEIVLENGTVTTRPYGTKLVGLRIKRITVTADEYNKAMNENSACAFSYWEMLPYRFVLPKEV